MGSTANSGPELSSSNADFLACLVPLVSSNSLISRVLSDRSVGRMLRSQGRPTFHLVMRNTPHRYCACDTPVVLPHDVRIVHGEGEVVMKKTSTALHTGTDALYGATQRGADSDAKQLSEYVVPGSWNVRDISCLKDKDICRAIGAGELACQVNVRKYEAAQDLLVAIPALLCGAARPYVTVVLSAAQAPGVSSGSAIRDAGFLALPRHGALCACYQRR